MDKKSRTILIRATAIFLTILVFMLGFRVLFRNPIIFASFASSVFAIFAVPTAHQSQPRVVVLSHLIAAITGYGLTFVFPAFSPVSAALAVGIASAAMIALKVRHAPAAATALAFSYHLSGLGSFKTFLLVLGMIGALGLIKAIWHFAKKFAHELGHEFEDFEKWIEQH